MKINWVCFISVEALQHVPCCVLHKLSKRNTKHATRFFLNSFETHPNQFYFELANNRLAESRYPCADASP